MLAAALGVLIVVARVARGRGWPGRSRHFVIGAAVVPAAVVAWLALAGALPAWRAIVFDYLVPLYSRLGRAAGLERLSRLESGFRSARGVALSLASALAAGRFGARHAVAALGVLYGVVHFVAQGKGWEYHLYPLAAFAAAAARRRDRAARWPGSAARWRRRCC